MCNLLLVCSPGAALCWSAVCGISDCSNCYSGAKCKELERSGSKRKVCLSFLGLCQWSRSFSIHLSLQWRLCAITHFRKEILQLLIPPVPIPSYLFLSPWKGYHCCHLHHFGFPFILEELRQSASVFLASDTFVFPSSPFPGNLLLSYTFQLPIWRTAQSNDWSVCSWTHTPVQAFV